MILLTQEHGVSRLVGMAINDSYDLQKVSKS